MSLSLKSVVPDNGLRFWIYLTAKKFNASDLFLVDNLTYKEYYKNNKEDYNGIKGKRT